MRPPREFENPLCAQVGGDLWFPNKAESAKDAKEICNRCPHQTECAEWGIYREVHGVWGGLSGIERRLIRRRLNIIVDQPTVEEWLSNAQTD